MARKLFGMLALISLVLLAQVAPGLADIINLPGQDENGNLSWTEYNLGHLGDAGNRFRAAYPFLDNSGVAPDPNSWGIAEFSNSSAAEPTQTSEGTAYTVTYNIFVNPITIAQLGDQYDQYHDTKIKFIYYPQTSPQRNISIISTDFTLTTTTVKNGNTFIQETLFGSGHNLLENDTYFSLTGTLNVLNHYDYATHNLEANNGYITDLQLTYGAEPSGGAQTPIPGAVWLLGTGLLGLGCVGWRRRS